MSDLVERFNRSPFVHQITGNRQDGRVQGADNCQICFARWSYGDDAAETQWCKDAEPLPTQALLAAAAEIETLRARVEAAEKDQQISLDAYTVCVAIVTTRERELAIIEARAAELERQLDTMNNQHRATAKQLAEYGERALAAERQLAEADAAPSLPVQRGET